MDNPLFGGALPTPGASAPKRRGRPPGSRNKRSLDLGRYIEAQFGGLTPGQQSAMVALVTPGEVRQARAAARELQIHVEGLSPVTAAMVVKAARLARALGVTRAEAWAAMAKERYELMPYIHQRLPQADAKSAAQLPQVVLLAADPPAFASAAGGDGVLEQDQALNAMLPAPVSPPQSHGDG